MTDRPRLVRPEPGAALGAAFWRFRVGHATSACGDVCSWLALTWWGLREIGSAGLGALLAGALAARLLLLPLAGALADRWSRRRSLLISYVVRGVVLAALFGLVLLESRDLAVISGLLLLHSLGAALSQATAPALLVELVAPQRLHEAQRITASTQALAGVVGSVAAAAMLGGGGVGWALAFDVVTYVVAALLLPTGPGVGATAVGPTSVLAAVRSGFRFVWSMPMLVGCCLLAAGLNFLVAPVEVLFPAAAAACSQPWLLGALRSALGTGAMVGAAVLGLLQRRLAWPRVVAVGVLAVGSGLSALALPAVSPAILGAVLAGIGVTVVNVTLNTRIGHRVPSSHLARTFATMQLVSGIAGPVGILVIGSVLQTHGVASGAVMVGLGLAVLAAVVGAVRGCPVPRGAAAQRTA